MAMVTMPATVFTTPGCPYCKKAKELLSQRGFKYDEVDVSNDRALRNFLAEITGSKTVPQVFVGGKSLGGADSLSELDNRGELEALMKGAEGPSLPQALEESVRVSQEKKAAAVKVEDPAKEAYHAYLDTLAEELSRTDLSSSSDGVLSGLVLLGWLTHESPEPRPSNTEAGVAVLQDMVDRNLLNVVKSTQPGPKDFVFVASQTAKYRLRSRASTPGLGSALNTHYWWAGPARPAQEVAEDLRTRILQLYDKHLRPDGRAVNYTGIREDKDFKAYVDATAELQKVDISSLTNAQLVAMFINLYNAVVIHALAVLGPEVHQNPLKRGQFFSKWAKYNIGGLEYTCDDMENGVLRGNRPGAAAIGPLLGLPKLSQGPFGKRDERRKKVASPPDARIHFALVCGAKSCPPIKMYTADTLEEGLGAAAEAFCRSEVVVLRDKMAVELSKIFKWYAIDFGDTKVQRLSFLLPYLEDGPRKDLQAMLDSGRDVQIVWREYDWGLNTE